MNKKTKIKLIGAVLMTLPFLSSAVREELAWTAAGILGLAVLDLSFTLGTPRLAAAWIRTRNGRK